MSIISKTDKIKALGLKDNIELTDEQIDILYNNLNKKPAKLPKKKETIITKLKASNNDPRYVLLLKIVNSILTNIGKSNITNLLQFRDIDRADIVKKENNDLVMSMEKELFQYFNKFSCGYYRKDKTDNFVLTFLRGACEDIGFKFEYNKKYIRETISNTNVKISKTHYFYFIE